MLLAMLWQSVALARVGSTVNVLVDLEQAALHWQDRTGQDRSHHHHDDGWSPHADAHCVAAHARQKLLSAIEWSINAR